ncbi:hypothetical protein [Spirochaeta cellobiosiphila]|uniref:hypothetical protein n=1 Tax=Spirochaeta cellobiosiphila TaxID=504483 RepID=UPI00040DDEB8|nr:hypothetical protein [Spirochaeta cellobiosiphila]
MIPEYFAIIGAFVGSLGGIYYLIETVQGKTQPNRVTWLLWGIFPLIIFLAQRAQGVSGLSWASFTAGFTPLLIVMSSFINKKSYWKTNIKDYLLMGAAFIGILLWGVTKDPNMAIMFSLVADFLAGLPTIIKAYKHPESESWIAYAISTIGFGISVLAIQTYSFENVAFIFYLFLVNAIISVLAVRKGKKI